MALTQEAKQKLDLGRGGSYSISRDIIKHSVYDTAIFGSTISDRTFFTQPQGAPWRNSSVKSKNETNMTDGSRLPNGQTFLIEKISVRLISALGAASTAGATIVQAFTNLIQSSVFEIKIPGREYDAQIHGAEFLPAISVSAISAATIYQQGMGQLHASGSVKLAPTPIYVDNLVGFSVSQLCNNPDSNVVTILNANSALLAGINATIQLSLSGILTRSK